MNKFKSIKGIIFDYGSALDVSGRNWLLPIHQAYASVGIDIPKDLLRQSIADLALKAKENPQKCPYFYDLKDFFISKARKHILWIYENFPSLLEGVPTSVDGLSEKVARHCYEYSRTNAIALGNILRELAKKYRLALVSNFNGNLNLILEDFGVKQYFAIVTTNPEDDLPKSTQELLAQTIKSMGLLPRDVLVVGDSISRDIVPAATLGCQTAWLQNILPHSETTGVPESTAGPEQTDVPNQTTGPKPTDVSESMEGSEESDDSETEETPSRVEVLPKNTIRLNSLSDLKTLLRR